MRRLRACATVAVLAVLAACGGGAKEADVEPEPMPEGGSFTGVYNSPQYGEMHMVQQGSHVVGTFKKDDRKGRIQGTVQGNVLRFQWTQKQELVRGNPTVTRGHGYFQYVVGGNGRHYLKGEWGPDENEVGGGPWRAVKLKNKQPKIADSQMGGSGSGGSGSGGGSGASGTSGGSDTSAGTSSGTGSASSSSDSGSEGDDEEYGFGEQPDTGSSSSSGDEEAPELEGLDEL